MYTSSGLGSQHIQFQCPVPVSVVSNYVLTPINKKYKHYTMDQSANPSKTLTRVGKVMVKWNLNETTKVDMR